MSKDIYYPKIESLYDRNEHFKFDTMMPRLPYTNLIDKWVAEYKIDGTNIHFDLSGETCMWHGRTPNAQFDELSVKLLDSYSLMLEALNSQEAPEDQFRETRLFGELYGGKIQKGGNYGQRRIVIYDVQIGESWLGRRNVEDVCTKLGLPVVPVWDHEATVAGAEDFVQLDVADPLSIEFGDGTRPLEGLVLKTDPVLYDSRHNRVIVKIKHKDYA